MPADQVMTYGIGTVARLTGLTTHTIRAWEKRHGAVHASRDASGRRRYSPADVERLTKLKQLTDLGERIGGLASRPLEELDARLSALDTRAAASPRSSRPLRVGLYGENAADFARRLTAGATRMEIAEILSEATPGELTANVPAVDCVLLETAGVSPAAVPDLEALARGSAERSLILVYGFARDEDLRRLAQAGVVIVRSPASDADLARAIADAADKHTTAAVLERVFDTPTTRRSPADAPRFTAAELTKIGAISTSIDCECPHHLATVISNLRAFERYSADCANLTRADAALHEYLYRETVRAGQIIENALRRLMEYEGIEI